MIPPTCAASQARYGPSGSSHPETAAFDDTADLHRAILQASREPAGRYSIAIIVSPNHFSASLLRITSPHHFAVPRGETRGFAGRRRQRDARVGQARANPASGAQVRCPVADST